MNPRPIAYLNSRYPALSHTFILREVEALRTLGMIVQTFSVRSSGKDDLLGEANAAAAKETMVLFPSVWALLKDQPLAIAASPLAYARAIVDSVRISPPGLMSRLRGFAVVMQAARLVRALRQRGIEHLHVHMGNNGANVALAACVLDPRLTYSVTIHGSEVFEPRLQSLKPKLERASFVRFISEFGRAMGMSCTTPGSWPKFHVVHCGVDTVAWSPRSQAAGSAGPLRLLCVGRLSQEKGQAVLLDACAALGARGVDWSLKVVGAGPMNQALRERVTRLGIADRVTFCGPLGQEKLPDEYAAADALVISSFREGIPVVLMEAMAMGVVAVSTQVGGVPELIEHGVSGFLVTPGSVAALADGLAEVNRRRAEWPSIRLAARERVVAQFDQRECARQVMALLDPSAHEKRPENAPQRGTVRAASWL